MTKKNFSESEFFHSVYGKEENTWERRPPVEMTFWLLKNHHLDLTKWNANHADAFSDLTKFLILVSRSLLRKMAKAEWCWATLWDVNEITKPKLLKSYRNSLVVLGDSFLKKLCKYLSSTVWKFGNFSGRFYVKWINNDNLLSRIIFHIPKSKSFIVWHRFHGTIMKHFTWKS